MSLPKNDIPLQPQKTTNYQMRSLLTKRQSNSINQSLNEMSPFMIFAVVLTVIYIIYFTGMICYDLYGKQNVPKDTAESFDVSAMVGDEQPTNVIEEDLSGSTENFHKEITDDGLEIYESVPSSENVTKSKEGMKTDPMNSDQLNEVCNEGTEEIQPEPQFSCFSNELKDYMSNKNMSTQRKIEKENVRDTL